MSGANKIIWATVVVVLGVGALASQFIPVRQTGLNVREHTSNAGELTSGALAGQTFVSPNDNLSGIGITFATYSSRENTEPVKFYLRRSISDQQDIRTGAVTPDKLGDNQTYVFEFEAVEGSQGQEFFFFVVSPTSTDGNAVTVDVDTRDPYHLGTAYLARGQGAEVTTPEILAKSGKQTADLTFATYHTVPLREAVVARTMQVVRTFAATWDESRSVYLLWLQALVPVLLFLAVLRIMRQSTYLWLVGTLGKGRLTVIIMGVLLVAGVGLRVNYASELPLTNDEGNYLYDAWTLRQGILAGGDGYVKAPIFVAWVALWQIIMGDTILAGRMSSIVIGALTAIPIYFLARDLWSSRSATKEWLPSYLSAVRTSRKREEAGWGRRLGLAAAAIWLLFGAGIIFDIYVHTQPIALFFGVSGLAVLLMALRGTTPQLTFYTGKKIPAAAGWFILAGVLLGLGVASRKSILALGLIPLLLILMEGKDWKFRLKHLVRVGAGFVIVIGLFLGLAAFTYSEEGFWEAAGYNSAEDGVASDQDVTPDQIRAYSIRGMTPFFRESLPLIVFSVIGLGVVLEYLLYAFVSKWYLAKLGWIAPWLVFVWAWQFFFEYEGEVFITGFGIRWVWYGFAGLLGMMTIVRHAGRGKKQEKVITQKKPLVEISHQPGIVGGEGQAEAVRAHSDEVMGKKRQIAAALLVPLWILGLAVFYTNWIKFHANYISEFIPPLVILSAYGAVALYRRLHSHVFFGHDYPILEVLRRVLVVLVTVIVLWSVTVSNYITFLHEHTGTFSQSAVHEAAAWAAQNIPYSESIFTGAAVVPYLSGHHTALDIAHPRWYAYGFTRNDPQRLNTFLPPAEEMVQAFRETDWVLYEGQTGFSFLMEYSEIEEGLERDFEAVKGIENGSNTLTFYRRVR